MCILRLYRSRVLQHLETSSTIFLVGNKAAWSLTRARARFCTWDRAFLVIYTEWGMRGWRTATQKGIWGFWWMASWIWVNNVPWEPKRPTISWSASSTALLASWEKGLSCSALLCTGVASLQVPCAVWGTTALKGH